MQLSENTLTFLKNFAGINPNIVLEPGSKLRTISESKSILAEAEIQEQIETEMGLYDLPEFLSVLGLFDTPELKHDGGTAPISITESNSKRAVKYFPSDRKVLTTPPDKSIQMPSVDVTLEVTQTMLSDIRRAASTLEATDLTINGDATARTISIAVGDLANSTSNQFSMELAEDADVEKDFKAVYKIDNILILPGDYTIELSAKRISKFTHKTLPITYWIAMGQDSTF